MDQILNWMDSTPQDLEARLNAMPELVIVDTPSELPFIYEKINLIGALIGLQEITTGIRESPEDYAKLLMLHQAKAKIDSRHYDRAIEMLKSIPEDRLTPELLFQCARTLFEAWERTQHKAHLQEAYERATDYLTEEETLNKQQHHWIGKILAEQADNAPYSEKNKLYAQAIHHLTQAITDEKDATGHKLLAEKQEEYADDCPDMIIKQQLRNEAINNYKKAYALTQDEEILESIRELEA